ncbi:MAG: phosphopyruvate hydratase [Anaerolineae bacterium]
MPTIRRLSALEILDSRGRPTVQAACELDSGQVGIASVPSGASTGTAEALELRDGDKHRFRGLGCLKAVTNITGELYRALAGKVYNSQQQLDTFLIDCDGTPNKSRLGANAILAVSLAFARAAALEQHIPLYRYFAAMLGYQPHALPRPTINLFSGGKHAGGQVAIQDVLVAPLSSTTMNDALAMTYDIYQCAAEMVLADYGMRALKADEGGLAPNFPSAEAMIEAALTAIERAGLTAGTDVALAVDVASTQFFTPNNQSVGDDLRVVPLYHLGDQHLTGAELVTTLLGWLDTYPIISIEDGLSEEDWPHWQTFRQQAAGRALIMGDDLLCTNPTRIQRAIDEQAANALLLKVNQIGTLTEAAAAFQLARSAGWHVTVSARSGETEDNWLADLAVGWGGDHIKIGSITQSERLAKYNRLLTIEAETGWQLKSTL